MSAAPRRLLSQLIRTAKQTCETVFGTTDKGQNQSRKYRRPFSVEQLEKREMMAASIDLSRGVLTIKGTSQADYASVSYVSGKVQATVNGVTKSYTNSGTQKIDKIIFNGYEKDDTFSNGTDIKCDAYGDAGNDWLYGGGKNDKLYGGSGNDHLFGRGGDDGLWGGVGDDVLDGGDGDDDYVFDGTGLGSDEIKSTAGVNSIDLSGRGGSNNLDLAITGWQTLHSNNFRLKLNSASAIDTIFGSDYADTLKGNDLDNTIYGNGGADTITGRGGSDTLEGGAGTDTFTELKTKKWTGLYYSVGGWSSSSIETIEKTPDSGYKIYSANWNETSAVRADTAMTYNSGKATVHFFLYPQQFGGGGARAYGDLTMVMAPKNDTIKQ